MLCITCEVFARPVPTESFSCHISTTQPKRRIWFELWLKALELGAGQKAEKITAIGGGTRNEFWMQNKADVSGRPVVTLEIEEATALGAAMLAGAGIGVYKDFAEAVKGVLKQGWLFEPNKKLASFYAELFEIYRDVYPASWLAHFSVPETLFLPLLI